MKNLSGFMKKEIMEQLRSGRLVILGILFMFLGIMNPAVAKLTPWMFEMLSDSLAENGMIVTEVPVDAMTSWTQFYKNIPMGLIAFVLLQSNIFTKEYQEGTLVQVLTKGLSRYKVVISKAVLAEVLWTVCYWMCFAITYGYNEYFWDNAIAKNLVFSVACWWLFGVWVVFLAVFFSVMAKTNTGVLAGTGGVVIVAYLIRFLPKVKAYSPAMLINTEGLLTGGDGGDSFCKSIIVTAIMCIALFSCSIQIFNKKQL